MLGLTKEEIKKEVIAWHNSQESFSQRSSLSFAIQDQNQNVRLGKTMDVIMSQVLPSLLAHILDKNNQAITKQLEEK